MSSPPSGHAAAVTPNDTTPIGFNTSRLYVGGAGGTVTLRMKSGELVQFQGVPVGAVLEVSYTHVMATGTAATLMVAMS
jgi:hypothetical protein